ncbi:thiol reductant ABC exporter subunit CydD [Apilactobacillus micheneri]|uniref:Thiol reductant ABC exporter subunit CydD n=1 Tax=Apilactobacillus micheneri TaxID=1899430 RepID=A0ABY2YZ22_9LACO|nr:thiol reductant ABC exporter subunit CydD [Apilactobacillus micheneri]TPR26200.1 thiol reductant ABC exporter subunit CydD [Apilactobacillus micheneri]TPR26954.1 thiol reductant ABC exporter subunit CydD [Apilactobacillus micheneri]TPR27812.1 thiol reductant ABC exporter subunit CydD [Apilactobacillus micheneri]TPR31717.1 thiol reductant ABC exporter subunit CydD [Apilactobacillus micheneri]TPR32121.1 thiol reductant ABC exporter subunit CydD [Apilactobacillus micheneri]
MFNKKLMTIPGIKKLIIKISILAVIQAFSIIAEAWFLSSALVNAWMLKKVTASIYPMLFFFIAFIIRYLITRIENQITDNFSDKASNDFKKALLEKTFELGPQSVAKLGSGQLITIALEGIDQIKNYLNLIILKTLNLAIIPWIILVAVFFVNALSGLVLLLVFPIIIYFMIILGIAARKKSDQQYLNFSKMSNNFINTLRGLKTLKLFGLSKIYGKNIFRVSENYRKSTLEVLKIALLSTFTLDFMTTISIAIVAVILGVRLINGSVLLFPALFALITAPDYFLPLRDYGNDYHATLDGKNALDHLISILDTPSPKAQKELKQFKTWNQKSTLKADHLSFQYDKDSDKGIKDVSFNFTGHLKVGIVGQSGSGKSTMLNLLGGWLQPEDKTNFKINGEKTDSLAQFAWQKHLSYIPQNPYLFSGTIAENIAFYAPNANTDDIKKAAQSAGLEEFINSLKDGMNTIIGRGGRGVSGGQAQRIALARVLLDQREIILLDEPTAHLDIETEYELKQTMLPIFKDHLVIFATHRLHWMNEMDYILVMENGKLVEQGNPKKLLKQSGKYRQLVDEIRGEDNNA